MCFGIGVFHYLNNPSNVILSRPRQPIQECPISRKDIAQNLERRSVPSVKHPCSISRYLSAPPILVSCDLSLLRPTLACKSRVSLSWRGWYGPARCS